MNQYFKYCLVFLCFLSLSIQAQDSLMLKMLDEIVVSSQKFPQKQTQTGKVITIIGKEIIGKSYGKTLPELLSQQVGLNVIGAQNALGTNQDVYFRGANSGYTLLLINGIPIYDTSTINNTFDINLIPLEQIEYIEILKGGQSTLYGSDAMAGVINIITKKNTLKSSLQLALSSGSFGTLKSSLSAYHHWHKTTLFLGYSHLNSSGFSSAKDTTSHQTFDRDGYKAHHISLLLERVISPNILVKTQVFYNQNISGLDEGAFVDGKDYFVKNQSLSGVFGAEFDFQKTKFYLHYSPHFVTRNSYQDSSFYSKKYLRALYEGNSHFLEFYAKPSLFSIVDLVVGIENRWQNMGSSFLISSPEYGVYQAPNLDQSQTKTHLFSTFVSLNMKNPTCVGAEAGIRWNKHSLYGSNTTFTLNPFLFWRKESKIFINYSSAFKVPTQYQLFSEFGNTSLKPAHASTFEIGVDFLNSKKNISLRAVFFTRISEDIISFQAGKYTNFDSQKDKGIEIEAQFKFKKGAFTSNFTWLTGEITTAIQGEKKTFENLFRRPKTVLNTTFQYNLCSYWNAQIHLHTVGTTLPDPFDDPTVEIGSYTTLDLYQELQLNKRLKIYLDLKNATNIEFYDIAGYSTRRLNFMIGIVGKF